MPSAEYVVSERTETHGIDVFLVEVEFLGISGEHNVQLNCISLGTVNRPRSPMIYNEISFRSLS